MENGFISEQVLYNNFKRAKVTYGRNLQLFKVNDCCQRSRAAASTCPQRTSPRSKWPNVDIDSTAWSMRLGASLNLSRPSLMPLMKLSPMTSGLMLTITSTSMKPHDSPWALDCLGLRLAVSPPIEGETNQPFTHTLTHWHTHTPRDTHKEKGASPPPPPEGHRCQRFLYPSDVGQHQVVGS